MNNNKTHKFWRRKDFKNGLINEDVPYLLCLHFNVNMHNVHIWLLFRIFVEFLNTIRFEKWCWIIIGFESMCKLLWNWAKSIYGFNLVAIDPSKLIRTLSYTWYFRLKNHSHQVAATRLWFIFAAFILKIGTIHTKILMSIFSYI